MTLITPAAAIDIPVEAELFTYGNAGAPGYRNVDVDVRLSPNGNILRLRLSSGDSEALLRHIIDVHEVAWSDCERGPLDRKPGEQRPQWLDHTPTEMAGRWTYLLDTNITSHIIKGDIPCVRERLAKVPIHRVAMSVITQAQLLYSVAKRGCPTELTTKVCEFLASVTVLPWTTQVAEVYSKLRATCESSCVALTPMDIMIAAHAVSLWQDAAQCQYQMILVTTGDSVFSQMSRISDLKYLELEDWTK